MRQHLPSASIQSVMPLLKRHDLHPVLVDIGASGPPRQTWDMIAGRSIFIGFDPDLREIRELGGTGFFRAVMIDQAVTAERGEEEIGFILTRSPYCSSTLEPDLPALSEYAFADKFQVERRVSVKATTLDAVLKRLELSSIDWFKTDSQGTDLRLFNSLPDNVRDGVLCVEVEPGLIDAYKGEDLFIDAHRNLMAQGFWLADANICGNARVRQSTIQHLQTLRPEVDADYVRYRCPTSPGWVEATYLRSVDQLAHRQAPARDYVLLWTMALMCHQWGFALDVALACETAHGSDDSTRAMIDPLATWLAYPIQRVGFVEHFKACIPMSLKQWIKSLIK